MKNRTIRYLFLLCISFQSNFSVNNSLENTTPKETIARNPTKNQTTIRITNNITDQMLSYKHWTGTYKPTSFIITIDGKPLQLGEELKITPEKQEFIIRYDYSFMNGYKTGAHEVICQIKDKEKPLSLGFSWDNEQHLEIENATVISDKKDSFSLEKVSRRKKSHK